MRILFVVPGYKPAWRIGGPIISVSALAESLVRRGHEVIVHTTNSNLDDTLDVPTNRAIDVDGVEVWYFERQEPLKRIVPGASYFSRSLGMLYSPKMRDSLDRVVPGVDVVHTHLPFIYPTFAAARAAFRHKKPLFYHQRGVFDPERLKFRSLKKMLYLRLVEIPILRRATTLVALTEAEVQSYARLGVETPCRIIPNGIDSTMYGNVSTSSALESLGIDSRHLVVLFLSRIHPVKGADRLLDAFIRVQGEFPESVLVLAGPDEFGLESSFRRRVESAGLTDRVKFPGMVSGELKLQLLTRADLFCLPSAAEGFSMAVLEALASQTAVLISPGCHFADVEKAGAGRVCQTEPAVIVDALRDLLRDRLSLRHMGQRGREFVREHYSWDGVTNLVLEAYQEGLARNNASVRVESATA